MKNEDALKKGKAEEGELDLSFLLNTTGVEDSLLCIIEDRLLGWNGDSGILSPF
jgi:hypothetical protein